MGLKPVKVSQLNSYIKRILQTDPILGNVSVTGKSPIWEIPRIRTSYTFP